MQSGRRSALVIAILGWVVWGLAACGPASPGGDDDACERSSECDDPTQRCVEGRCVNECGDDRDCTAGLSCVEGLCVEAGDPCRADRECRFDQTCVQGLCQDIEGYCEQNRDCPNGSRCDGDARRCVADPGSCVTEAECVLGELCQGGRCVPDNSVNNSPSNNAPLNNNPANNTPANNNPVNNNPANNNPVPACRLNSECAPGEICTAGVCGPECAADRDCPVGEVCVGGACAPDASNNNPNPSGAYWDTCDSAAACTSGLCLGTPPNGRCVAECDQRASCPQQPVSSLCIQSYHLVTRQAGGDQLIGLCYQDDTGTRCDPSQANSCFDGLCVQRAPGGALEGICSIRCQRASDCAAGMACGPKEFQVNGQAQLIDVCVPIGEACAGVGAEAADQCYSSFCVTEENNIGLCTTLCADGRDCPAGWSCQDVGGGSVCLR